ncbi:3-hydroxyacyl-CoA dehydrogenase NAD-binding domain-containing protein [Paracoccus aestuariivivens]|uniref:3-hydroxyacyl-CoA dehydrogenase n=1 Tax=Paracoccus aestuariivivens TaxID=1820333 RepID=A0A6L6J899_9RHOB|nr:3-hydroxyacyl-CoA dehydrogenase NAD-binding domain-containing protein [Paracoccus aestuariivivens]MTH76949.1 3-hydroxyacyl-CoA dehydrogenase [Paracoccus aestuariivivens]
MSVVTIARQGDIATVTVDNPPVNALGLALRQGLWDAVAELDADPAVRAVVLICAGRTFIAGADVTEFGKPPVEPHLPELVARIEAAEKPWVAAIHGSALGGGFEVALGCRFRVALPDASVGLPEVTLGIIPGAGGTVRTPRLCGVETAVDMATAGKPLRAPKALAAGLIDAVIEGDLLEGAVAFARAAIEQPLPLPVSAREIAAPDAAFWTEAEKAVAKAAKGAAAPARVLASIRKAAEVPFTEAMDFERETFMALRGTEQAAALRTVFFAERAAPRPAALRDVQPLPLKKLAVIGGGTMGAGIIAAIRDAGLPVILIERDDEAVARGLSNVAKVFDGGVKRGKLTEAQAQTLKDGVTGTTDYAALVDVDMVIEAVFEEIGVKRAVFTQLGEHCRTDAVLATNTSYLDPRTIAEGLPNPSRFIGLHFFSPANVMKLLEIVPTPETSPETLATGFALGRLLKKIPVQSGICEGFIGNRILKRYRAAAEGLVRKGVPIARIDAAMRSYGLAMGPFEAQDLGGLDIAYLQREGARAAGQDVPETLGDILVRADRKGQKTGGGWYDYVAGDRKPQVSATVTELLAAQIGPESAMSEADVATALVGEMAAEGQAILNEGIASSPTDIDLVEIHGYGFPRWRGGPMFATRARD